MKLLFITPTGMSEAVLATGVLDQAVRSFPGVKVTVACPRNIAPLYEAVPGLDRIVTTGTGGAGLLAMWLQCFYVPWSVVFDLRNTACSGLMLGRRVRKFAHANPNIHLLMQFAQSLGMDRLPEPKIWTDTRHAEAAAKIVRGSGPLLVLSPTADRPAQEWPQEYFIDLVTRLTGKGGALANAKVALAGSPADRRRRRSLVEFIPKRRRVDLMDEDHPLVLAEVCRRATLFVGNDSEATHVAAAAGCPTVALYGPTRDDLHGPWGAHTKTVRTPETADQIRALPAFGPTSRESFMGSLTVTAVVNAATGLLKRKRGKAA